MNVFNFRLRNEIELQGKPVTTKPVGVKNADQVAITEALISELICPPPPSCSTYKLNNDAIDSLIVPAPEKIENIEIPKKEDPVYSGIYSWKRSFLNDSSIMFFYRIKIKTSKW
jgi:hypothetical protein